MYQIQDEHGRSYTSPPTWIQNVPPWCNDLLKINHLLQVVRESINFGKMLGDLNSTFIELIPKKLESTSFDEFRPISWYNVIYKLVVNIIVQRLKPILSFVISQEKFSFLQSQQIHDAVSLAQEACHSSKRLNLNTTIMKIVHSKSFDKVHST